MKPPSGHGFNPRGFVLIAIAIVFIGLAVFNRSHSSSPGPTHRLPSLPDLKLLLTFLGVIALFAVAAVLGVCCGHLRVMARLGRLRKGRDHSAATPKT